MTTVKRSKKLLSLLLAIITLLSLFPATALASSIGDGSRTCTMSMTGRKYYLTTTAGTRLGATSYAYTTNDGLSGPAYCIDHGLDFTARTLPITGKYSASPKTAGAYANGYPQHSLDTFLGLYLSKNPILSGLTEDEYAYATQLAVWSTLGQLAVDGTAFSSGRERIEQPVGDSQQMRVFRATQLILNIAGAWDRVYQTGMYIRVEENVLGGNLSLPADMTLDFAANNERYGFKREVIGGVSYYTHEYIFASATSTYYMDYNMEIWADGAPAGTIFVDAANKQLPRGTFREKQTWTLPTTSRKTGLNSNGFEYSGTAKLCVPVATAPNSGEITIQSGSYVMQYEIYLAYNDKHSEQSYIIADPSKGTLTANAVLSWGSEITETGSLKVTKVNGGGNTLAGAEFRLTGTDGDSRVGTTDINGELTWTKLKPDVTYTLTETKAPAGYGIVDPINIQIEAARTNYVTVQNTTEKQLTVHKVDAQNGYSLAGAVISFEQIDGSFKTSKTTDHAGRIQLSADALPVGSYKVYEVTAPEGYAVDATPQTVHWDGRNDVTLTFQNVRKPTLIIYKCDEGNHYNLPHATFEVYKNGQRVTTVTTNDNGLAYVSGISSGYYTIKEIAAPPGYVLDEREHSVYVDVYDPATTDDPRITITNQAKPSLLVQKYDSQTGKVLPGCCFEVYRDAILVGTYITNAGGQILLTDLTPGTYLVKEVAAPGTHVVNSTPQQIELKAGQTETATLIFLNSMKPGIHLVKLDSVTMKPLVNATYLISKVGGTFAKEYTTDRNGEIDLTGLEPGAYTVRETKAPEGYLIDDGIRVIQINPDENAQFVFSDTPKPSLVVVKYDPQNNKYLAGATFRIAKLKDGAQYLDRVTDANGRITIDGMEPGLYSVQEIAAPSGYVLNDTEYHVELFPGKASEIVVTNEALPNLQIVKTDAITGAPVAGVTFTVRKADSSTLSTVTTTADGTVTMEQLDPGVYEVTEQSVPSGYLLDTTPQLVTLVPNKTAIVQFQNYPRPSLEIIKTDTAEKIIPDAVFTVAKKDGTLVGDFSTGQDGKINVYNLDAGYYIITEKSVPAPYILDTTPHEVLMVEGKTTSITIENKRLPDLTVSKVDSITKDPIQGAKFSVWYAVNGSLSGELRKVGGYASGEDGTFTLKAVEPGWYRITETETAPGYAMKEPSTLDVFMEADVDQTVTFENQPLNSLIIKKVSATTGEVLQGAKFRVRYFEGVTGTGGTTIGEFATSAQGTIVITGLKAGTYLIEETRAPDGFIIDDAPKTVYVSGKEQAAVTVEFANQPDSGLTITKLDSVTKKPLAGAVFEIRNSAGGVVGNSNGQYTTDASGTIHLPGLPTDTYIIKETKAPTGYVLDRTPQTVKLIHGETHSLTFYNAPKGALVVTKLDVDSRKPLAGAIFKITTSSGEFVAAQGGAVSSNGLYTTDKNGQITLTGLEPNTYIVTETKAPIGYELDKTPQTVAVNAHDTQTLTFYNTTTPEGGLRIVKLDEETRQPIRGVEFEVTHMNGQHVGTYRTDSKGIISLPELAPGWYTVTERRAADGYELDAQPRDVEVKDRETATVEVTNRQQSNIVIRKVDSQTGEGLYGATFVLYDNRDNPVGEYRSNQRGYVYIDGIPDGKYKLREIDAPEGYILDTEYKTVYVRYGGSSEIRWENTAITGQIQIAKYASEDNAITGGVAGGTLKGAVFEVVRQRSGVVVGYLTTDARGVSASAPLPLGRYLIREVQAPPYYRLSGETFDITLEYPGQIIKLAAYNKSALTGVALTKTGVKEVLTGGNMSYTFTVANTSNVPLENFYWHDRIPTDATTAFSLTTGTYSQRLNYRILYKTNCNDYRVLASNLLTTNNYGFMLNALPLMAGEVVTDVDFDFGTVPAGFQSVIKPTLTVAVSPKISSGYQIVNRADAGGKYQGVWEAKNASWVTIAKNLNPTSKPQLPQTGY